MSSRSGLKTADGQRLSVSLAALCAGSTIFLEIAARRPLDPLRSALDATFNLIGGPRPQDVDERELTIDLPEGGQVPAKLYEPQGAGREDGLLVFFHGGGWVVGSLESHAPTLRAAASRAHCRVLAVGYRKAPEHPFPAAFDDARGAYRWALAHADELGVDPARIAVGGDSAGGNLAASVCLHLDPNESKPAFAWLIYPLVDADVDRYPSAQHFAKGPLLSRQAIRDMIGHYAPSPRAQLDPRVSVIESHALERLPRTYVATAGMDILRDQGERFGDMAREAGVDVEVRRFDDMPHGFISLRIDPGARACADEAIDALRAGLRAGADVAVGA